MHSIYQRIEKLIVKIESFHKPHEIEAHVLKTKKNEHKQYHYQ